MNQIKGTSHVSSSEYVYFLFQLSTVKHKVIQDFMNCVITTEESLEYHLCTLNKPFFKDPITKIQKFKLKTDKTFEFVYRPELFHHKPFSFIEARRLRFDIQSKFIEKTSK